MTTLAPRDRCLMSFRNSGPDFAKAECSYCHAEFAFELAHELCTVLITEAFCDFCDGGVAGLKLVADSRESFRDDGLTDRCVKQLSKSQVEK